jgi:hypothetical protein
LHASEEQENDLFFNEEQTNLIHQSHVLIHSLMTVEDLPTRQGVAIRRNSVPAVAVTVYSEIHYCLGLLVPPSFNIHLAKTKRIV